MIIRVDFRRGSNLYGLVVCDGFKRVKDFKSWWIGASWRIKPRKDISGGGNSIAKFWTSEGSCLKDIFFVCD